MVDESDTPEEVMVGETYLRLPAGGTNRLAAMGLFGITGLYTECLRLAPRRRRFFHRRPHCSVCRSPLVSPPEIRTVDLQLPASDGALGLTVHLTAPAWACNAGHVTLVNIAEGTQAIDVLCDRCPFPRGAGPY